MSVWILYFTRKIDVVNLMEYSDVQRIAKRTIEYLVYRIRGQQVMLDSDLADI